MVFKKFTYIKIVGSLIVVIKVDISRFSVFKYYLMYYLFIAIISIR